MLRRSESDDFPKAELSALLPGAQALRMAVYMSAILLPILIFYPSGEREGRIHAQCCRKVAPPSEHGTRRRLITINAAQARKVFENLRHLNRSERDDAPHRCFFDETAGDDAKPATLDEAGDAWVRPGDERRGGPAEYNSIVSDKPDGHASGAPRHQRDGQPAFAGPRPPKDDQTPAADGDPRRVHRDVRHA